MHHYNARKLLKILIIPTKMYTKTFFKLYINLKRAIEIVSIGMLLYNISRKCDK